MTAQTMAVAIRKGREEEEFHDKEVYWTEILLSA